MSKGNERFSKEAAQWDKNPDVHRASEAALQAILARFPCLKEQKDNGTVSEQGVDVLEIGCGTGLLSFLIAPYVRSLLAVDAAEGMIDAFKQKLTRDDAPGNVTPLCIMLEDPEDTRMPAAKHTEPDGSRVKFDLILSHLVLHHIPDLPILLHTMHGCLKTGGSIALTDFEDFGPEARKFHPESKMGGVERHGIPKEEFAKMIKNEGLADVIVEVGWTMRKDVERFPGQWGDGKPTEQEIGDEGYAEMDFPFLICTAKQAGEDVRNG